VPDRQSVLAFEVHEQNADFSLSPDRFGDGEMQENRAVFPRAEADVDALKIVENELNPRLGFGQDVGPLVFLDRHIRSLPVSGVLPVSVSSYFFRPVF